MLLEIITLYCIVSLVVGLCDFVKVRVRHSHLLVALVFAVQVILQVLALR